MIRQYFAKRIVDHLEGKQDPEASFRHFIKKGGFALLDILSAGIRDVLVVSLKEEKRVRFHSTYTASHEVIYLHLAVQWKSFIAYWSRFTLKGCLNAGSKKTFTNTLWFARLKCSLRLHACR